MIKLVNVFKNYKKNKILNDINLVINDGEFVTIIGPSGCGKTTIIKMINGLEKPTSGEIFINDISVLKADLIELRRTMGYVIQQTGLFSHLTIEENIGVILKLARTNPLVIKEKTLELMAMVKMDPQDYLWRYPSQLSGGQLQRIGVARAFACDPDIILMDEPFSALDPITKEQLQNEMLDLQSRLHKTIVFVTHDMSEAIKLSDRICILNYGEIQQFDTPENILKNPKNEFVTNFVGANRIWESPELIRVKDIMITSVVFVNKYYSVFKAMELMRFKKVDTLVVVDHDHHFLGMVFAKDLQKVSDKNQNIGSYIMDQVLTTSEDTNLIQLLKQIKDFHNSTIPVISDGRLVLGLITKSSLVTTLSTQFIEEMKFGETYE
ncbi:MAG: ABC transporter ATP-binding protein [Erysipelotrichaceae bacterium]